MRRISLRSSSTKSPTSALISKHSVGSKKTKVFLALLPWKAPRALLLCEADTAMTRRSLLTDSRTSPSHPSDS